MNFQYLEDLDCEFLTSNCDFKETVLVLNENSTKKSRCNEEEAKEIETSSEGVILEGTTRTLEVCFLKTRKSQICDYISYIE